MKFTVKVAGLATALSRLQSVVGSNAISLRALAKKRKLLLSASKDGRVLLITVDAEIESNGDITVDPSILSSLIARHNELSFELDDSSLKFQTTGKGKKYNGDLAVLPHDEVEFPEPEGDEAELNTELVKFINEALPLVRVSNVYTQDPLFLVGSSDPKRGSRLGVYDNFHFAYARQPELKSEAMDFCIPLSIMDTVIQIAEGDTFSLTVTENRVTAIGKSFRLALPAMVNPYGDQSISSLESHLKDMGEGEKSAQFSCLTEDFRDGVTNSMAIVDAEGNLELSNKADQVKMHLKTNFGQINRVFSAEAIEWDDGVVFRMDPVIIDDLLRVIRSGVIHAGLKEESYLLIDCDVDTIKCRYVCNLM
jgi:hypothetical protein